MDKTETTSGHLINNLAGHVYYFGADINTIKCEVLEECDCFSGDFLFVNKKDFNRIGCCVAEKSVIKSTYTVNQGNIFFNYDSLHYFTEADENNEVKIVSKSNNEYLIKIEKGKPFLDILTKFNCKDTLFYKKTGEKSFGTLSLKDSINLSIDELKKEGFCEKMNFLQT